MARASTSVRDYAGKRIMCKLKTEQLIDPVILEWLGWDPADAAWTGRPPVLPPDVCR